jgi:hypothetical protein
MERVRTEIIRIVKHCPGYLVHLHSFRFKGHILTFLALVFHVYRRTIELNRMTMKIELVGGVSQLAFAFFFILISTSIQGNPHRFYCPGC